MNGTLRISLTAGVALAFVVALAPPDVAAKDDAADPAAREWTQTRGNSARTAFSAVEPLRSEPVDAWKQPLGGTAIAEPVAWGATVFAAVQKDKSRRLLAFDAVTGAPVGDKDLGAGGRVSLAVWQGVVIVADATQIRTFPHQGGKFGSGWSARGEFGAPPCLYRGYLFACDGPDLLCLDVLRGGAKKAKVPCVDLKSLTTLDETKSITATPAGGAVSVYRNASDGAVYAVNVATFDTAALLSKTRVEDLTGSKTQLRYTTTEVIGTFPGTIPAEDRWDMVPCRVEPDTPRGQGAWIVLAPRPFSSGGTGRFVPDAAKASGLNLVTPPAVLETAAYSYAASGDLQSWKANGQTATLVQQSNAPSGSRPGPGTAAGGVVFIGNYAIEVAASRVIWAMKHAPVTSLVPVGDKRLVFATATEMVSVADAAVAAAAPAPSPAPQSGRETPAQPSSDTAPAPQGPRKLPVTADGVLLDDGRQIEGTYTRRDDTLVIHPKDGGEDVTVPISRVVVAESNGSAEFHGDDGTAFRVWREALRGAYCDAMEAVFLDYAKGSCVDDARRVIRAMRENGATEARLVKLDQALNGKAPKTDAARVKRLMPQEEAARSALVGGYLDAAAWCGARELEPAATAALNEVGRLRGGVDAALEARAAKFVPAGFPFKSAPDAARQWMTWADALLPSGARFADPSDEAWKRLTNPPWSDGSPLCFRSRNVLLFCMDRDVKVCGKAMQLAEGTVRAVHALLDAESSNDVSGDADRLEVRIHKDRKAYLAEEGASGKANEWSAGYYSPAERISRFYVDHGRDGEPDLAELGRVLTHELTHHYMEMRWMRGASGHGPGYWVIEGMATFVENQAVQMDRRGLDFDDETVPNLDAMSQLEKQKNLLFKMQRFVDMSHGDFDTLRNEFWLRAKLRNSIGEKTYSERGLWYDQAGALCFFFLFKRGAEGREAFIRYVRDHYRGAAGTSGWMRLGYETPEELDKDFAAWLSGLRGK